MPLSICAIVIPLRPHFKVIGFHY